MVDQAKVEKLKKATSTSKLLKYLEKELDWPIDTEELEDNFFEYSPEELQFKPDLAAKIKSISRLRPPSSNIEMPWGIFFIEFYTKNLPLLALRRILNQFVEKKRQSKDLKSWEMGDLLFVSNYGEDEQRKISLCLFNEDKEKSSLPRLKVIEWSDQDTSLALEGIANTLKENLEWPDNDLSTEDWQEQWQSAFISEYRAVIKTSKVLAQKLAELAKDVRNRMEEALAIEHENGYLHGQLAEFKKVLIHDLDEKDFADMYAQTIAYGLLTAQITNPKTNEGDRIGQIAITNPFLKELLKSFLEPNEQQGVSNSLNFDELGINEIKELLDNSDMPSVIRDFGAKNPQEDPVIHFYEFFLKQYDAKEKVKRGVFYTPRPVVSFIVRSVDKLLRTDFGLEDGLADTTTWGEMIKRFDKLEIPEGATQDQAFVQILDPATGTGTFLVETIDLIYKTMTEKWQLEGNNKSKIDQLWNDYVPNHLLPRLHGYELMMAPYAIAHMKIGLKLHETGYRFESEESTRIFLTNSLEPPQNVLGTFDFALPVLANEAEVVNTLKREQRFTVVIGNPPYSHWSGNMNKQHRSLVEVYKYVDGERIIERGALQFEINIQDDYVKFIRFAEMMIEKSKMGILGYITNSSYLDSATFRGMRSHLFKFFENIHILNLHGSLKASTPKTKILNDQNVFDIQQGVAINISWKNSKSLNTIVKYEEIISPRQEKYDYMLEKNPHSGQIQITPRSPEYLFVYRDETMVTEYERGIPIDKIFKLTSSGIKTNRDGLTIAHSDTELDERMKIFLNSKLSSEDISSKLGVSDKKYWNIQQARKEISPKQWRDSYTSIAYRPFDTRCLVYHPALVHSMRRPLMSQISNRDNLVLLVCRQQIAPGFFHVFVTKDFFDCCVVSNRSRENTIGFPLYIKNNMGDLFNNLKIPNIFPDKNLPISPVFLQSSSNEIDELEVVKNLFFLTYAQLHSQVYRSRYQELLQRGYPRIFSSNKELCAQLIVQGEELINLHLMESRKLENHITKLKGSGDFQVKNISYSKETVWINKEQTQGFNGIKDEVWNFHIGSYKVCEKWLKGRQAKGGKRPHPGQVLSSEDINHYQKIIVAISETIRIMGEIDEVIEEHGGWPDAFSTSD